MRDKWQRYWFEISVLIFGVLAFFVVLNVDAIFGLKRIEFKDKLTALTAIPLFVVTLIHMFWGVSKARENTQREAERYRESSQKEAERYVETLSQSNQALIQEQRLNTMRDYIGSFHTNQYLQDIFFNLVYSYTKEIYTSVNESHIYQDKKPHEERDPIFPEEVIVRGSDVQRQVEGSRFYHPLFMKTSLEEKKIDSLLGYFDVVGYYFSKGYLEIEDIVGTVGFYLDTIKNREATREYMDYIHKNWAGTGAGKRGCPEPYLHLLKLIKKIEESNKLGVEENKRRNEDRAGIER